MNNSSDVSVADATMESKPETPLTAAHGQFPPLGELFKESWERMTSGALNALWISLLSFAATFGAAIVAFGALFALTATTIDVQGLVEKIRDEGPTALSSIGAGASAGLVIAFLVTILLFMFISAIFTNALILAFGWAEQKPTVGSLVKAGLKSATWFIAYSIVAGFLAFGGTWFFLIPSLLISMFFSFGIYELVLEGKKPFAAMRSSTTIIAENFGPILGRLLIFFVGYLVISLFLPALFQSMGEEVGVAYSFVNLAISIPLSWFSISYMVTLYKQAKEVTPANANRNGLFWTLISLSLIGWVIFIVMSSFIIALLGSMWKDNEGGMQLPSSYEMGENSMTMNTVPSSCGLSVGLPLTSSEEKPPRYWIYEERPLEASAFRTLAPADQLRDGVLGAFVAFKTNDDRLTEETFKTSYPGYHILCIENTKNLDLDGFTKQAMATKERTVSLDGEKELWGEVEVQALFAEGLSAGDYYKEPFYLAVTPGPESKLILIQPWGVSTDDEMEDQLNEDFEAITSSLKYRDLNTDLMPQKVSPEM